MSQVQKFTRFTGLDIAVLDSRFTGKIKANKQNHQLETVGLSKLCDHFVTDDVEIAADDTDTNNTTEEVNIAEMD